MRILSLAAAPLTLFIGSVVLRANVPTFEPNRGQFAPEVHWVSRDSAVSVAVTSDGLIFRKQNEAVRIRFKHTAAVRCHASSPVTGEWNYLARTPAVTHVPRYAELACPELYPGVDWLLHSNAQALEQDWSIAPHHAVSAVDIRVENARAVFMLPAGAIRIESSSFAVIWKKPIAYQDGARGRDYVPVSYAVHGNRIALTAGAYDRTRRLVIDPVLDFVYVVAGNDDDRGLAVGVDGSGFVYVAGLTQSTDFQTTPGSVPSSASSVGPDSYRLFVRKLSPDGSKLLYSTELGTANLTSHSIGMRVDAAGNVYLASNASGQPMQVTGTTIDAQGIAAVYKFASEGDRLIYANRVLSKANHDDPVAIAIDNAGNAYVAAGSTNVSIAKIDPTGQQQLFLHDMPVSKYFGGLANVAVGPDGSVYLAGNTASGGLETTPGAWKATTANIASSHGYLIRLKPDGTAPVFATYVGGDYLDEVHDISVDSEGSAYVVGATYSDGKTPGLSGTSLGLSTAPRSGGFIAEVNAQGDSLLWSVLLPCPQLHAIALDNDGNVFVSGQTDAAVTIAKINASGSKLLYYSSIPADVSGASGSSRLGVGLAVDANGAAYVASSSSTLQVPELRKIARLRPNAWFAKVTRLPSEDDLAVSVQPDVTSAVPGENVSYTITVRNNGSTTAEDVSVTASISGPKVISCRGTGSVICSESGGSAPCPPNVQTPCSGVQANILSIAAGATEKIQVIAAAGGVLMASASSVTSDTEQDNNTAVAEVPLSCVALTVTSDLYASFRLNGSATLLPTFQDVCLAPNSIVTIEWPTPQNTRVGAVVFKSWFDGSTENPKTFSLGTSNYTATGHFELLSTAFISPGGITNAASYSNSAVAPGQVATIYGFNLGGGLTTAKVANNQLVTELNDTRVLFDGIAAPLVYATDGAVSAIVPYNVAGKSSTTVTVKWHGTTSSPVQVPVVDLSPGLFTANAAGYGQAAALNQDGTLNAPSNPAHPGQVIVLYGTGEGITSPLPADGAIASWPAPVPVLPVTVTIGGVPARVLYAGGAPGETAGLIQINAEIPAGLPENHHTPVVWSIGGKSSQTGVTIALE